MGWSSCTSWSNKKQVVNELKNDLAKNYNIIADKSTKTGLWAVIEHKQEAKRYIFLALIQTRGGKYKEYYVKEMTESSGPCYYDCPLEFLELVPCPTEREWAAEWRQKVMTYHNTKVKQKEQVKSLTNKLERGQKFELYDKLFTFQFYDERNFPIVLGNSDNKLYKLKKKQIGQIKLIKE